MSNGKVLFKSNITALRNVTNKLYLSQTMSHSQVILSEANQERLTKARQLIDDAISELYDIK